MHCFLKMSVNGQKNEFAVSKAVKHDLKALSKICFQIKKQILKPKPN